MTRSQCVGSQAPVLPVAGATAFQDWSPTNVLSCNSRMTDDRQANDIPTRLPNALVERVNQLLMAGQMPPAMKTIIANHVATLGATDTIGRARAAIHLTATSPQFCTQR